MIIILISLFCFYGIAQHCSIRANVSNIYPIYGEVYSINMMKLFGGLNLQFICTNCPIPIYNFLNPVDSGNNIGKYTFIIHFT